MTRSIDTLLVLALVLTLSSCGADPMVAASSDIADASLSLTDEQWERLASKRIFFGHQSVGENIISGIRILEEDASGPRLRILSADTPEAATGPGLIEAFIGQNGSPASKADD